MAQQIEFKPVPLPPSEALRDKVESAPFDYAEAVLKAYAVLDMAEKHGMLDLLRGTISAEDTIISKVAGYANTPESIHILRNLMVMGKALGNIDPEVLNAGANDLTASVVVESRKRPGLFSTMRRMMSGDALRGLSIAVAALESIGRTARTKTEKPGGKH